VFYYGLNHLAIPERWSGEMPAHPVRLATIEEVRRSYAGNEQEVRTAEPLRSVERQSLLFHGAMDSLGSL